MYAVSGRLSSFPFKSLSGVFLSFFFLSDFSFLSLVDLVSASLLELLIALGIGERATLSDSL